MPRKYAVRILARMCKGCGICVRFCPHEALEMSEQLTPRGYHPPRVKEGKECGGCRSCELMCPDMAIFIEEAGGPARKRGRARA